MASDSGEPTRRKHHRSTSPDDAEERSKRRKHRHHRSHRHHHRSKKDKDESKEKSTISEAELVEGGNESGVEEAKLENNGLVLKTGLGFDGVDYDMEEGEIVDDGLAADKLKSLDSDVESGEINPNENAGDINTGVNDDLVERIHRKSLKLEDFVDGEKGGKLDVRIATDSQGPAHSDAIRNHRDGEEISHIKYKKMTDSEDDVEHGRRYPVSGPESHDKFLKESSHKRLRSPEQSRRRSRSRSILQDTSAMGTPRRMEDRYHIKQDHRSESGEERLIENGRNYRHNSRDYPRDKERERSSSRYAERTERYYGRESHDKYRESSRDRGRERDRTRETAREREDKERDREISRLPDRDRSERDRGIYKENTMGRERGREGRREMDRDRDRHDVRTERNADRDRFRDGVSEGARARSRDRERDRNMDNVNDRFSRRQRHGDEDGNGERERENGSSHRRYSENYRERSTRTEKENLSSKDDAMERVNDKEEREEDEEDYQQRISMQLAEQEEDEVERIKEESRRRRQAILEKYKNQQKIGSQLQDKTNEKIAESPEQLPVVEVNVDAENVGEGAVSDAAESSFAVGKIPSQKPPDVERPTGTGGLGEGSPKSERSDDMFRDDIFGESPAGVRKTGKAVAVERSGLNDNWDDAEGYYGYRFGEILDTRYEIIAAHGKGVFSTVVRAKDLHAASGHPEEVAIKIIRNNETMYKAGMDELIILNKLAGADPDNKRHCVRYLSNFKFRNHLCLVFESLHMNLRELLKKFGRNIGLKLTAVRTYAKQLFIALKHLRNCGVLHCDIKPDNMLVNEAKNVLKLCDFGNAMFSGKNEITPYLVSRFYRAPEISLPYDHPMDMWSVGCCLFELYTGKVLFPGATNNDMLRLHMELKGPFPKKMLRKGGFTDQHFDQDLNFLATEEDPVTKKIIRRLLVNIKPNDFGSLISGSSGEDPKMVSNFKDLMEKIFVLDPDKRLTVSQALSHPFITGK